MPKVELLLSGRAGSVAPEPGPHGMAKHLCSRQCAEEKEAGGSLVLLSASCVTWANLSVQSSFIIFIWKLE